MRLDPATSLLCVIDIQERLLAAVPAGPAVVRRATRLARAAGSLGIPAVLTEQYPQGLGPTPADLVGLLPAAVTKLDFSAATPIAAAAARPTPMGTTVESLVICGLETHVCIAHSALDLLAQGYGVFVVVDAVASRHVIDHEVALRRLEGAGAVPVTSEAVIFEWCRSATHPQFQALRRLVVEPE